MRSVFALLIFISINSLAQNALKNPGFEEEATGWNFWGGKRISSPHSGSYSLRVELTEPKWSGADQTIQLPEAVTKIEVSGWMKTENIVRGKNSWEMARIGVEFLDAGGTLTGGYPPVTAQKQGTSEWTFYKQSYNKPADAKSLKIQAVLGNCTGVAFYDDLEVKLFDANNKSLQAEVLTGPIDEGQWYEIKTDPKKDGSHYVDWSSLLDAPAGKHGFLQVVNGHFQFEDGTPTRFWGTNLVAAACFPEKKEADSVAARLAKMGCNLVRLHHMDAPWSNPNIFGNGSGTMQLSPESLDKLDYLISALKKKGIYIYLDLLVHRQFTEEDGVKNTPPDLGGKQVAYFDDRLIDLQKLYIRQLLEHKNTYTNLAYKDEPAIAGSEFINESSGIVHFGGDILTPPYREELENKFYAAGYQGKKLAVFDIDWEAVSPRLKLKTAGDVKASLQFLSQMERNYYMEMKRIMQGMGVKYPVAGSNFPLPILTYQRDNLVNDVILTNDYWDHPQLWKINNDWSKVLYAPINNTSILRNPTRSSIINISKYKWYNKPFLVTEINACYPNEYILEALPFIASYARLQDMDGLLQFDFGQGALGSDRIGAFSLSKMPDHLAQWAIAAPVFLRGDVQSAKGIVIDKIKEDQLYSLPSYSDFLDKYHYLTYITKVAKTIDTAVKGDDPDKFSKYYNQNEMTYQSETGELFFDSKNGLFILNTPKSQGVTGTLNTRTFDLPMFKLSVKNKWASVHIVSKDNKPLSESKVFYLVAVTPSKMTGQKYNDSRTGLINTGELPLMAQVLDGSIIFKTTKNIEVIPLSTDGRREKALTVTSKDGGKSVDLSKGRTFVYEIRIK